MSDERNEERTERKAKRNRNRPQMQTFTVLAVLGDGRMSEMTFTAPEGFTPEDVDRFQARGEDRGDFKVYRKPKYTPKDRRDNDRGGRSNYGRSDRGGRYDD